MLKKPRHPTLGPFQLTPALKRYLRRETMLCVAIVHMEYQIKDFPRSSPSEQTRAATVMISTR
jgi:hypothetical protein